MKKKAAKIILQGKFIGNTRGFGFVAPSDGGADIFIPPHLTLGALDGDAVEYKIVKESKEPTEGSPSKTGKVIAITARTAMVGAFFTRGTSGYVRPVDTKIPYVFEVPPKTIKRFGLVDGHRVVFTVDKRTDVSRGDHTCQITEVLGHINDPGMDVLTLVRQADVPYEFPEKVMAEANALPDAVLPEEIQGRLDLRSIFTFTIDGDDTKDIDDAISFEKLPDGSFKLGVHIADVSHYVREGMALGASALDRGTSIYLADRVIPMLPHRLSSGVCSLFPNVDRLTLSCMMTVSPQGHVLSHEIAESVIHSQKRWTYDQVQNSLDAGDNPLLLDMDGLREVLRKKREAKGALDFDLPEAKIRVDDTGKPISIEPHKRTNATGIIEEFMILCNETIAAHFLALEAPFVYRTHEPPSEEKILRLGGITKQFGFKTPQNVSSPIALQRLLAKTANTAAAQVVATAVLHSLPQARYTPSDPTHYGLASQAYCHFTSPIRRYADLQAHRIIKAWLNGKSLDRFDEILPGVCAQCSKTERIAEALEREVTQLKKVQFMAPFEGEVFEGTISGVTSWGVYVVLPNTVEGIVPVEHLRRRQFVFDKEKGVYNGKKKGKEKQVLTHGTPVTVRLVKVAEDEMKLMFGLVLK